MKKYSLVVASVLLAFTGCGRGWLPCLHRGAPCYHNTCSPEIGTVGAVDTGCEGCGASTVGYQSYPAADGSYSSINRLGSEVVVPQPGR